MLGFTLTIHFILKRRMPAMQYGELAKKYRKDPKYTYVLKLVETEPSESFNLSFDKPLQDKYIFLSTIIHLLKDDPFAKNVDLQFVQPKNTNHKPFFEIWINQKRLENFNKSSRIHVITTFETVDELRRFLGFVAEMVCCPCQEKT